MRKKSYASRLGVLAVALTLVTTCLVGGTMAKYTTTAAGTGSGTVAKFNVGIKANETGLAKNAVTIPDLFTTGREDGNGTSVVKNKLAPGTSGYFELAVTNNSDVKVKVTGVTFTKVNGSAAVPMKFAVTDKNAKKPDDNAFEDIDAFSKTVSDKIASEIGWGNGANSQTVQIWWQWDPASSAEDDTKLGTEAATAATAPTYGLDISVTADQVIATN